MCPPIPSMNNEVSRPLSAEQLGTYHHIGQFQKNSQMTPLLYWETPAE